MKRALILSAALALAAPLAAETFRMRDGSYQTGEVVSADDELVRIRFAHSNLELDIKWDQLAPGEAKRVRARTAEQRAAAFKIDGEVVYTKSDVYEGLVEELGDKLRIKTAKGMKDVPKVAVTRREKVQINALSVYTAQELYDAKKALYDLTKPEGNFDLGDLCLAISLWANAKEHFAKVVELDPSWRPRAEPRLAKADAGIREEEAAALLKEAEALFAADKFDDGLAKLNEIKTKYAGTSAAAKAADMEPTASDSADSFKTGMKKEIDKKRAKSYYDLMGAQLGGVASDKKLTFEEIKSYVEKTMPGELLDKLAVKEKVDRAQLETEWKSRDLDDWKTASYEGGSWQMEPDTLVIEGTSSLEDVRNKAKNAQLIADLKKQSAEQRKLVNEWWAKQSATTKKNWLTAYAAEKIMIVKPPEHPNCSLCQGKGILGATKLCTRCLGIGKDRVVTYK